MKSIVNWFAVNAKVGGNVFYAIAVGTLNRNPRKFMKHAKS